MTQLMGGGCVGFRKICQAISATWFSVPRQNQVAGNRAASASTDSPADTSNLGLPLGGKSSLTRVEIAHRHTASQSQKQHRCKANQTSLWAGRQISEWVRRVGGEKNERAMSYYSCIFVSFLIFFFTSDYSDLWFNLVGWYSQLVRAFFCRPPTANSALRAVSRSCMNTTTTICPALR
ncbi:hypothetical protein GGI43DRAFT_396472 [Trichoderma evansii]